MKRRFTTRTLFLFTMTLLPLAAQETPRSTAIVQYSGNFQAESADNGIRHDASNSGGVLATYRLSLTERHAIETTYGYTLNTQNYALGRVATVASRRLTHAAPPSIGLGFRF